MRTVTSFLLLGLLGGGCSYPPPPSTVPVKGQVTLEGGKPLSSGWVTYHPKDPPGNEALGQVRDGVFSLGTFAKADGAVSGRYVVTVTGPGVPKKYQTTSGSPLASLVGTTPLSVEFRLVR